MGKIILTTIIYFSEIKWFVNTGGYIHQGDKIGEYGESGRNEMISIISDFEGKIVIKSAFSQSPLWKEKEVAIISKDETEIIEYKLANRNLSLKYEIQADPFSENVIKWSNPESSWPYLDELVFCDTENVRLNLILKEGTSYLSVMTNPKYIDLQQNDRIVLVLANDEKLTFCIQGKPLKCNISKFRFCCYIKLFKEDFDILCNSDIVAIRIVAAKSATPYDIKNLLFSHCFFITFIKACQELNSNWNPDAKNLEVDDSKSDAHCSVYFMKDVANGFYKIGISNKPEYREYTLQSEKPTIKMICNHQYPTRIIAKSIESALHSVFAAKRIRGEWFELNANEVEQIKATLR